MRTLSVFVGLVVSTALSHGEERYEPEWESLKKHNAVPEWFADAKLGVYFHWGVYNVPGNGNEWYGRFMYEYDRRKKWGQDIYEYHTKTYGRDVHYHDFVPQWKADAFSAKDWVDQFEYMGAKFIGTIAEHHDGFSLWESEVNPWNSKDMGPGIDVVGEIADEVKKRDIKFMATFHHGFHMMFYPKPETSWLRPASETLVAYEDCEVPQDPKYKKLYCNLPYDEAQDLWLEKLNEVIEEHCPDYLWMDFGPRFLSEGHRKQFLTNYFNKAQELNKDVVVNTKGTYFPTDVAVVNLERATIEDIAPEVWVTDFQIGSGWAYNKDKRGSIDPRKAIRILAEVVSKNGVMILSAAPMAEGIIPEEQVASMKAIGDWLQLYGEAIYSTRPFVAFGQGPTTLKRDPEDEWNNYGKIKAGLYDLNSADIRYTRKADTVYAIQLGWPGPAENILLEVFADEAKELEVKSVEVLGSEETIKWKRVRGGLKLTSPKLEPAEGDAAIVYKIEVES
ncbi:alpha-L-fucosidase [Pelagicoccus mobilis]